MHGKILGLAKRENEGDESGHLSFVICHLSLVIGVIGHQCTFRVNSGQLTIKNRDCFFAQIVLTTRRRTSNLDQYFVQTRLYHQA